MVIDPDFLTHWKTRLLSGLLEDEKGPIYVIQFWSHCQSRRTSEFEKMTPRKLAVICGWQGDPDLFYESMIEAQFIDVEGDRLIAHDFESVNYVLFRNWKNGKKGGRPSNTHTGATENPEGTQEEPISNPRGTDKIRLDRIREGKVRKRPAAGDVISELEFPDVLLDVRLAGEFEGWVEKRLKLKKPGGDWVEYFQDQLTEKLAPLADDFGIDAAIECVKSSRIEGYQGLFPDRYRKFAAKNVTAAVTGPGKPMGDAS